MDVTLLEQGAQLMLVGMGTVFVFLALLVLATTGMSHVVMRLMPEPAADAISAEEVAAISAAIIKHRASQQSRNLR